ncbi:MAG: Crp/Fnr family transcriptional regulator [Armatimonadota bacterium]|nr:Crp/Fnr family transcriptional regulator [Armatimonadota bacterium]MDR7520344.1 Crp/Fnr family transcriptional regulator [Armatimonadota bacterium]
MVDRMALLRRVVLFSSLSDERLAILEAGLRRHAYRRDTTIFHKGQDGDALYLIESGRVRIFLQTEAGGEHTLALLGPTDFFGELALLDQLPRSASAEAVENSVLYTLGRADFQRELTHAPNLAMALLAALSARQRRMTEYTESLALQDVDGRLAHLLLDMAERHGHQAAGLVIDLHVTQAELARMIGATRERINRALAAFKAAGLIQMRGRRIVITSPQQLRARMS